ncbi:MAG: F0F1 ATP synthase subunit A [Halioglobus sp.]|nr:F0F1 ATP synthase subunit A [Halioglobus sp.]
MQLTPDEIVVFSVGGLNVNVTIVNTWIVMALLVIVSMLVTRNLRADVPPDRWRTALEVIVKAIQSQIEEITPNSARHVLYFAGTLFLFIALSNLLLIIPGFAPPTASLSTTAALALSVLVAVPLFGIARGGLGGYLKTYIEPSLVMLPFNIIGEFSRGISLAIRLYGNVMSGAVIAAILLSVAPFFFPVVMSMLGLLTGMIQAYIFAILATVYISSATAQQDASASAAPKRSTVLSQEPSALSRRAPGLPQQPPPQTEDEP